MKHFFKFLVLLCVFGSLQGAGGDPGCFDMSLFDGAASFLTLSPGGDDLFDLSSLPLATTAMADEREPWRELILADPNDSCWDTDSSCIQQRVKLSLLLNEHAPYGLEVLLAERCGVAIETPAFVTSAASYRLGYLLGGSTHFSVVLFSLEVRAGLYNPDFMSGVYRANTVKLSRETKGLGQPAGREGIAVAARGSRFVDPISSPVPSPPVLVTPRIASRVKGPSRKKNKIPEYWYLGGVAKERIEERWGEKLDELKEALGRIGKEAVNKRCQKYIIVGARGARNYNQRLRGHALGRLLRESLAPEDKSFNNIVASLMKAFCEGFEGKPLSYEKRGASARATSEAPPPAKRRAPGETSIAV